MHVRAYFEVEHGGNAINSLDFHPTGKKLVTGGHGSSGFAGEVKIWDISGIYGSKKDIVMIGTAGFQYCINCVRFSMSGKDIAVADDGRNITILRLQSRTKNSDGKIKEIYQPAHTIMGHILEVLHVEFSPTTLMLASTSIDGSCKIWNMKNLPQCLAILDEKHGGHKEGEAIKGCSWDPMGKLIATQSSDRSLKIWKTYTWECLWTLTQPFLESSQSTMYTRMDWSPDGAVLIVPSTVNNSGPSCQIIMRKDWTFEKDLVGHRKPMGCVSFCKELRMFNDEKGRKFFGYVVAIGGRDRTLSVWSIPKSRRPIVVIQDIVKLSIVDMRWFGRNLAISSLDGTVRFIIFKESEIGISLSENELNQQCIKLYGCGLPAQSLSPSNDAGDIENDLDEADQWSKKISEIYSLEIKKDIPKSKSMVVEKPKALAPPPPPPPAVLVAKPRAEANNSGPSMIVRSQTGKKRIMTTFLGTLETAEEPTKISKNTTEFPERHIPTTTIEAETKAIEKPEVEESLKKYLRNAKFNYEPKKSTRLEINNDAEMEWIYDNFDKNKPLQALPYFGLYDFESDSQNNHPLTITNEITHGIGKKVARIWNLSENVNTQIDGHVIGCDINKNFLVVITENNLILIINRKTGATKTLSQLSETPRRIRVFGNSLIVLFTDGKFSLFQISSSSPSNSKICSGSLAHFKGEKGQLIIHNSLPMFINQNQKVFIASMESKKWIQAALPTAASSRFPSWLFPTLSTTSAALFNRIITHVSSNSKQKFKFIPSEQLAPVLNLSSELRFFTFILEASKPKFQKCEHFRREENDECQICQVFNLFTKFSMNLCLNEK